MSKTIMIATVPHSGTCSLRAHLDAKYKEGFTKHQEHCSKKMLELAKSGDYEVYTTWRSPYRVAASFGNRQKIEVTHINAWIDWWKYWSLMQPYVTKVFDMDDLTEQTNSMTDKHGLHKAIDEKDWDKYYSMVPQNWIEEAYKHVRKTS